MSDRVYRQAFLMALAACVALAGGIGYLLLHRSQSMLATQIGPAAQIGDPVVARGQAVLSRYVDLL